MTSVARTLRTLLQNLGDACVNSYSLIADAPIPVPSLVIPPSGPAVPVDCGDLLIVACTSVTSAFQGPPEACAIVMQANLSVTVTRCVPNLTDFGHVANRTLLTDAALSLADDVSTLFYGVTGQCRAGTLWTGFAELGCESTRFRDFRPGAGGDIAWFTWNVSIDLTSPLLAATALDEIAWQSSEYLAWQSSESVDWVT